MKIYNIDERIAGTPVVKCLAANDQLSLPGMAYASGHREIVAAAAVGGIRLHILLSVEEAADLGRLARRLKAMALPKLGVKMMRQEVK